MDYNNSVSQKALQCKYCDSFVFEERPHPMHGAGAWCKDCGKFIKWLGKARTESEIKAREARRRLYTQEHMANQDPTQSQLSYLDKLGYRGIVGSRLHASRLIEAFTAKQVSV